MSFSLSLSLLNWFFLNKNCFFSICLVLPHFFELLLDSEYILFFERKKNIVVSIIKIHLVKFRFFSPRTRTLNYHHHQQQQQHWRNHHQMILRFHGLYRCLQVFFSNKRFVKVIKHKIYEEVYDHQNTVLKFWFSTKKKNQQYIIEINKLDQQTTTTTIIDWRK